MTVIVTMKITIRRHPKHFLDFCIEYDKPISALGHLERAVRKKIYLHYGSNEENRKYLIRPLMLFAHRIGGWIYWVLVK